MKTHITANEAQPFCIVRDLEINDDAGKPLRLEAVKMTIQSADFSPDVVESEGFNGDWVVHLSDDVRFAGLSDAEKSAAEDACFDILEDMAAALASGDSIPCVDDGICW